MNHQWPPEVIRAMHQFAGAAPVAPSLGSVLEQRQIAPSSQPPATDLVPEERFALMEPITVSRNKPTREPRNRGRLVMAAAAVVVVVGIAGIEVANNRDDDRSPSATAVPTVAPTTAAPRRETGVFEGEGPRVTYIVPDGWYGSGTGVWKSPNRQLPVGFLNADDNFYIDCPSSLLDPQVGPTVDDLVSALVNLPGIDAETTAVTIDGFDGKQIELTFPSHYDGEECSPNFSARAEGIPLYFRCNYGGSKWCDSLVQAVLPNQHQNIWVLDVDGSRLVIMATSFPDTPQQDRADQDEIVASIQIG